MWISYFNLISLFKPRIIRENIIKDHRDSLHIKGWRYHRLTSMMSARIILVLEWKLFMISNLQNSVVKLDPFHFQDGGCFSHLYVLFIYILGPSRSSDFGPDEVLLVGNNNFYMLSFALFLTFSKKRGKFESRIDIVCRLYSI